MKIRRRGVIPILLLSIAAVFVFGGAAYAFADEAAEPDIGYEEPAAPHDDTENPHDEAAGTEIAPEDKTDWGEWAKRELAPVVIMALSAVASVYALISPVIIKFSKANKGFIAATGDIKESVVNNGNISGAVNELTDEVKNNCQAIIDDVKSEMNELGGRIDGFEARIGAVDKSVSDVMTVLKTALCNLDEMAEKGISSAIAKVGTDDVE